MGRIVGLKGVGETIVSMTHLLVMMLAVTGSASAQTTPAAASSGAASANAANARTAAPSPPQSAYSIISVDPRGGFIRHVLPFDESFILRVYVGDAEQLRYGVVECSDVMSCKSTPGATWKTCEYNGDSVDVLLNHAQDCNSTPAFRFQMREWKRGGQTGDSADVLIDHHLAFNHRVAFRLVTKTPLSAPKLEELRLTVEARLSSRIDALATGTITAISLQQLIGEATKGLGVDIELRGSLLGSNTLEQLLEVSKLNDAIQNRKNSLQLVHQRASEANGHLAAIQRSPGLSAMLTAFAVRQSEALRAAKGATPASVPSDPLTGLVAAVNALESLRASVEVNAVMTGRRALGAGVVQLENEEIGEQSRWDSLKVVATLDDLLETRATVSAASRFVREGARSLTLNANDQKSVASLQQSLDSLANSLAAISGEYERIHRVTAERQRALHRGVAGLRAAIGSDLLVVGNTLPIFETRATYFVSVDVGVAAATYKIGLVEPYIAINVYGRPVNKNRPLTCRSVLSCDYSRRLAMTLGLTATSVKSADRRDDVTRSRAAIIGAGARITDAFRLGAGAMVLRRQIPTLATGEMELAFTPYLSLSIDWDAKSAIGKLFDAVLQ